MENFKVENFSFSYPKTDSDEKTRYALKDISFAVNEGDFVLISGPSGSGKSTLLRHLKHETIPHGNKLGKILYKGEDISNCVGQEMSLDIGFVMQNIENQIVTDTVWHELAFGLENLGLPQKIIRARIAEMASFFGIHNWFRKSVSELSGGQKQILNLASVMAMQPKVLLLDEPTAQLDPIAALDFLSTIERVNRDFGITVIITEHRLEDVFAVADRVIMMDKGEIAYNDTPENIALDKGVSTSFALTFPTPVRLFSAFGTEGETCPLTVRDGRKWLKSRGFERESFSPVLESSNKKKAIVAENIWFRYEKKSNDVLRGTNLELGCGELLCVLGGNGAGKSTLINAVSGLFNPYRGKVKVFGEDIRKIRPEKLYRDLIACLPQNPQTLFTKNTVKKDLMVMAEDDQAQESAAYFETKVLDIAKKMGLLDLLDSHPYDLSGGEQQKLAFAKILLRNPKIIMLDEPTKGLDAYFKIEFAKILHQLLNEGMSIIMCTHDAEFAASYADSCAMFFDGEIVSQNAPRDFFAGNSYYTTAANRMSRDVCPNAVTYEDVVEICNNKEK